MQSKRPRMERQWWIGREFGFLKVLEYSGHTSGNSRWRLCKCGRQVTRKGFYLRNGDATHCGCMTVRSRKPMAAWGRSVEYRTWQHMLKRCHNPLAKDYERYGGRGIRVCDKWRGRVGFAAFFEDMGSRPTPQHSIDRIDNSGNYEPGNCRWATITQQSRNKRNNRILEFRGHRMCLAEIAELTGVRSSTIRMRVNRGISVERAVELGEGRRGRRLPAAATANGQD